MSSIFTDTILNIRTHNRVMFGESSRAPSSEQKRIELQTYWCRLWKSFRRWYQIYSKYKERVSEVEKCCEFWQRRPRPQVGECGGHEIKNVYLNSAANRLGISLPVQGVEPKTDWISPLASVRCRHVWRFIQVILQQYTFPYVLKETQSIRNTSTSSWSPYGKPSILIHLLHGGSVTSQL
jgi:hypothetical protein